MRGMCVRFEGGKLYMFLCDISVMSVPGQNPYVAYVSFILDPNHQYYYMELWGVFCNKCCDMYSIWHTVSQWYCLHFATDS